MSSGGSDFSTAQDRQRQRQCSPSYCDRAGDVRAPKPGARTTALGARPPSRVRFAGAWSVMVITGGSYWLVERIM